jgi:glycosyltransferase involved in cell wall biosynthesis
MIIDQNKIFRFNNFGDACGGTEIMVKGLLENVSNDLLKKVDIVVSYPPQNYKKNKDRISIIWLHDLATDPYLYKYFTDKTNQEKFDYFIFVSYWQKEMFRVYFDLPYEKCIVLKNAIVPTDIDFHKWKDIRTLKLIYDSTPQRGLEILFEVFKHLYKEYGNKIELNVFSSFDIYGSGHSSRNEPFINLYKELQEAEGVNYYGSVGHDVLIDELKSQHIWCLPSIWQETSCISLMEAMSAGCICIHNDLGALPETAGNYTEMYRFTSDKKQNAKLLYERLKFVIDVEFSYVSNHLIHQKMHSDSFYNWKIRGKEWEYFLESILYKK